MNAHHMTAASTTSQGVGAGVVAVADLRAAAVVVAGAVVGVVRTRQHHTDTPIT